MEDVLVPLGVFTMVVLIVGIVYYFGSKNRANVLETVKEAARNGQVLDAETIKALGMPQKNTGSGDLKAGAILIAIAASFLVLGFSIGSVEPDDANEIVPIMTAVASFPGFIGIVLLGFGFMKKRENKAA